MESNTATLSLGPPISKEVKGENEAHIFDFELMQKEKKVPEEFKWPSESLVETSEEELDVPLIDLRAIKGDEVAMAAAAELVREACMKHGFFQVTNHGVDPNLITAAFQEFESIFKLPLSKKLSAKRNLLGYSGAHSERYASRLPWKETFSIPYKHMTESHSQVIDFIKSTLGEDHHLTGLVYEKYSEAMKGLSVNILELLGISLGVDGSHYEKYFEDAESLMRLSFYPPCIDSNLVFGTGPHCDPSSLTILFQDQVGGLQVFVDNKWLAVRPRPDTFVINIGDTFMALSNGIYKSCLHRVLVNKEMERKSLAFFVNLKEDKTVRPPENIFGKEQARSYPDFKYSEFCEFVTKHYRPDSQTLEVFVSWLRSKPSNN
ncbi:Oxoglutarate/iron-dependent dioxygenase [Sesbania bispinosa]|nr:Oxoglutarate/iron-dependent dioxygenase [Sesbania bispinosa]